MLVYRESTYATNRINHVKWMSICRPQILVTFFCCRVLGSCRVPDSFDARFSCLYRCYQLLGLAVEDGGELGGEQLSLVASIPSKYWVRYAKVYR